MRSRSLLRGVLAGGVATVCVTVAAHAQIEEVVVTAQKRAQDVQAVPITVDAFTGEALKQANVNTVNDLQTISPSLFVYTTTSGASDTTIKIRGVGTTGNNAGLEGAVGTFIDGVYRNRSGLALGDLIDVERIEVLEGPQSTLFGKNTSAGALSIITNSPDDKLGGFAEASVSSYGGYKFDGWVNVPVTDTIATRWDGVYDKHDGYIKALDGGPSVDDRNRYFVKGQGLWTPNDDVSFRLIADYSHGDEHCCGAIRVVNGPTAPIVNILAAQAGEALSVANRNKYVESLNGPNFPLTFQDMGISGELNWQINDAVKLTNIAAYRNFTQSSSTDSDFTGAQIFDVHDAGFGDRVVSEEFRLTGRTEFGSGVKSLDWLAGVYYTHEAIDVHTTYQNQAQTGNYWCGVVMAAVLHLDNSACFTGDAGSGTITPLGGAFNLLQPGTGDHELFDQYGDSYSGFAQGTLNITDRLSVTGGLRYSHDQKTMHSEIVNNNPAAGFLPFWIGDVYTFPGGKKTSSNALTGTANVQYFVTDSVMAYVSYSRGYKSGGFNLDRTAGGIVAYNPSGPLDPAYKAETSDNYEAGVKSKWFDNRLLLNATIFDETFDNLQVLNFDGVNFHIYNEPKGTSKGFEVQSEFMPVDGLTLNGSVTYADTRYGAGAVLYSFDIPTQTTSPISLVGKHFTNSPLWSTSVGATYSFPVTASGYTASLHADGFFGSSRNTGSVQGPEKRQAGYALLNGRISLAPPDDNWELSAWCRNCTNAHYLTVVFDSVGQPGSDDAFIGDPAVYGGTLSIKF
jgi:outer membrane receptor protein involved in Fe transport